LSHVSTHADLQIVIPIYNDWDSVRLLLPLVDEQLGRANVCADILLADDGSFITPPESWNLVGKNLRTIRILRLHRNLGHQRAICVSLCYLREESKCKRVLVMDGDGEDDPCDIPRLLGELGRNDGLQIVFAQRLKRSEGWLFSFFYAIYRLLHRVLVGHSVRVGNFSIMTRECLDSLCTSWELWNHYAASVFATRQAMAMVATSRARRLAGKSTMDFPALVMHGLSALSVFSDRIGTRLLIMSALASVVSIIGMVAVTLIRLTTGYAIPGWATNAFGLLAVLFVQIVAFMFTFCFLILFTRGLSLFIPVRDCRHFVLRIEEVWHGCGSEPRPTT
jgi:polyisoprenyl-phosphate glycosyltransferase